MTLQSVKIYPANSPKNDDILTKNNADEASFSCKAICQRNLPTFNEIAPTPPGSPQGDPKKFIERQKCLLRRDKLYNRKICFDICGRILEDDCGQNINFSPSRIIDWKTTRDLNLLMGSLAVPTNYLGGSLCDSLYTEMGKTYLLNLLTYPTDNVGELVKRQGIIQNLQQDEIYYKMQNAFEKMQGTSEAELLSFWGGKMVLPGCLAALYFKTFSNEWNNTLNQQPLFLAAQSFYTNGRKALGLGISTMLIPAGIVSALHSLGVLHFSEADDFTRHFAGNEYARVAGFLGGESPFIQFGIAATVASVAATTLKGSYNWFWSDIKAATIVQNKLVSIAKHYRAMKDIYELCKNEEALTLQLQYFYLLEDFFNKAEFQPLFKALDSNTFNSEAEYFFNTGNILVVWEFLQKNEVQREYEKALVAMAEIDAFMGAATKVKTSVYCLPTYVQADWPKIKLVDFFNPQLNEKEAITSNFENDQTMFHGMITGQNGSGKSTAARAIVDSIILAQTLGIAPAKTAELTPFSYIRTSMPSTDDLGQGYSGFTGELEVINKITSFINEELALDQKAFVILDEPFKSTSNDSAKKLIPKIFETIKRNGKTALVVLSNEKFVAQMAKENKDFKLLKVEDKKLVDGCYEDQLGGAKKAADLGYSLAQ